VAKLHFKYGAMNSGKSDTLIKTAYNYGEQGLKVITIKPSIDTKSDDRIIARGGASRKVDIIATPKTDIRKAIKKLAVKDLHCVLVDESQFLSEKQIDQLYDVAKRDNISVIAYGLRADFRQELFPGSKRLFEIVDNIEKLPTMCRCGSQAEFNCRLVDGKYVFEGAQVAIDGEGEVTYNSLCGNCYNDEHALAA
jgi:thymidine kinase